MTVGEMKKRVRSVLDTLAEYRSRRRSEMSEPSSWASSLSSRTKTRTSRAPHENVDMAVAVPETAADATAEAAGVANGSGFTVAPSPSTILPASSKSIQLMDELTRDLIKFQELFELALGASTISAAMAASVSQQAVEAPSANGAPGIETV